MNIEEVFRRYIKKKKLVDSQQSSKMRNDKRKSSDKFCSKLDELVFSLDEDITTDEFDADEKDFSVKEDYVLNCLRSYCKLYSIYDLVDKPDPLILDNEMEKEMYETVGNVIRSVISIEMKDLKVNLRKFEILLISLRTADIQLDLVFIKGVIAFLFNYINNRISFSFPQGFNDKKTFNSRDTAIFVNLFKEFESLVNISPYIQRVFEKPFECFKTKTGMHLEIKELVNEIFWENVFKYKKICNIFINFYFDEDLNEYLKQSMRSIVRHLFEIKESIFPNINTMIKLNINDNSMLASVIVQNKLLGKQSSDSHKIQTVNDCKSIDDLYNFIVNDETKTKKKRIKKKPYDKLNKENLIHETTSDSYDPIVDDFKSDITKQTQSAKVVEKIKPKISNEWIRHISLIDS